VYGGCLDNCDVVIHLAAATGKAAREEYFAINSTGTRYLLAQCKRRDVKRFLYASSIVVKYTDNSHYYYAQSKQEAELSVKESGLNYTIVRPTIVLGKESPSWKLLSMLSRLRAVPVLGDGSARIQPIAVDDLADAIVSIVQEPDFRNEIFDLGGPEILSFEDFLRRVHRLYRSAEPRIVHLPYKPVKAMVAWAERYASSLMPLNAGQLSVFVEDGTIAPNRLYETRRPHMESLDTLLKALTRDE
jgi:NADH dehydrogenase